MPANEDEEIINILLDKKAMNITSLILGSSV